jgi:hypothetical protein
MRRSRGVASVLMAVVGLVLAVAGPVLAMQGVQGLNAVKHELAAQKIAFPADRAQLPEALQKYAGEQVVTGDYARAYADLLPAGATQRASLLSAYQADRISWLEVGLGVVLVAIGAVFALTGYSLQPPRIVVPDSPEALETLHLRLR